MSYAISPGIERAAEEAARRAAADGAPSARIVDWLIALLADDDGRAFELLSRLGIDAAGLRENLSTLEPAAAPAPDDLYRSARQSALRLRGDPDLTTDLILLAVLAASPTIQSALEPWLLTLDRLEAALRSPLMSGAESDAPAGAVFEAEADPVPIVAELPSTQPRVTTDAFPAARILDANLNRARESLRVLDDYARFVLNDRMLTDELKSLRHRLVEATGLLPATALLQSRDTEGDVGTSIAGAGEYERATPSAVAAVNFKRLQESLRSLEEFGKISDTRFARAVERIRYEAYTLERATTSRGNGLERLASARVYVLLTESQCVHSLERTIAETAAGGASIVQLREKSRSDRDLLALGRRVRDWTSRAGVLFIMNDRPDLARLVEADGVHLGQDDLPVREARQILGPDALVGVSTHSIAQVKRAVFDGADYLGVGPTFPSTTKSFDALAGLSFVREAFAATSLPAFALGGIAPGTIAAAVEAGANRVAVSAAVTTANDPRRVVRQLLDSLPPVG